MKTVELSAALGQAQVVRLNLLTRIFSRRSRWMKY